MWCWFWSGFHKFNGCSFSHCFIAISTLGGASEAAQVVSPLLAMLGFFLLFAFLAILRVWWLYYGILSVVCRTLAASSLAAVERVVQDSDDSVRYGEGLADVLDYGDI